MKWIERLAGTLEKTHPVPDARQGRASSVLLCLGELQGEWQIVLTKRTQFVQTHKGQVSLPGGLYETEDGNLLRTALREMHEEIGVLETALSVLGTLPVVETIGRVHIYPWVAHMKLPYNFLLNQHEVERVLMLPLSQLLNEGLSPVTVQADGVDVKSEGIYCDRELVWGATARILSDFRNKALVSGLRLPTETQTA